jgi:replicative DNA helicase
MSSIGIGILKSVIAQNLPFSEIVEHGIDETFLDGNEKDAYNFVKQFKYKHNQYPKLKTIEAEVPGISFTALPEEPVEYWATEIKERKKFWLISSLNGQITEYLRKNNIPDAVSEFKKVNDALLRINQEFSVEDIAKIQEDVLDRHDKVQRTPGISGIPFGHPLLDNLTYGQQGGDFNVLIGQTGSCKSYFSISCAKSAYNAGKNVMVISPEMPAEQIARRVLAIQMGLADEDIRKGKLSMYAVQKARKIINEPISIEGEEQKNWFKILPSGMYTDVNNIVSVASEYKPDLLVIDGFYMLSNKHIRTSAGWQEDESVIYTLKNFALHSLIPILGVTQYNRNKPGKLEGAKGSQAVEHTASNYLSLEFETPSDRESRQPIQTRVLKILKSRDGDSGIFKYEFDFRKTTITELNMTSGKENLDVDDEYVCTL